MSQDVLHNIDYVKLTTPWHEYILIITSIKEHLKIGITVNLTSRAYTVFLRLFNYLDN